MQVQGGHEAMRRLERQLGQPGIGVAQHLGINTGLGRQDQQGPLRWVAVQLGFLVRRGRGEAGVVTEHGRLEQRPEGIGIIDKSGWHGGFAAEVA